MGPVRSRVGVAPPPAVAGARFAWQMLPRVWQPAGGTGRTATVLGTMVPAATVAPSAWTASWPPVGAEPGKVWRHSAVVAPAAKLQVSRTWPPLARGMMTTNVRALGRGVVVEVVVGVSVEVQVARAVDVAVPVGAAGVVV